MKTSTKFRVIACVLLIFGGVYLNSHPEAMDRVSAIVQSPLSMLGFKSTVTQAWIVEESSERSRLPQPQIIAIRKAETLKIKLVDPNDKAVNAKSKAELESVLKAVGMKPLPQLVRKWSNGRTTSVACPLTFDKLKEAVP